jgi:hypothetical protein
MMWFFKLLPMVFCKATGKTGGSRTVRRHTFARQQKYAKILSPCRGQYLCLLAGTFIALREPLE